MTDPFAQFMSIWVPSCGLDNAICDWQLKAEQQRPPYIIPDLDPFLDTSGKYITGRKSWREHLRLTGTQEFSREELKAQTECHRQAKANYQKKMAEVSRIASPIGIPPNAVRIESRTAQRVMERLEGRPRPDRPTLIKIAMEERLRK